MVSLCARLVSDSLVQGHVVLTDNVVDVAPPACQNGTQSSSRQQSAVRKTRSDCLTCMCVSLCNTVCGRKQNIEFVPASERLCLPTVCGILELVHLKAEERRCVQVQTGGYN